MQVTKEIASVSDTARLLGLSRARLYQLMKQGVFPEPTRPGNGKRPFFTREQQEQCVEVRRTNRGVNGQTILFYAMRSPSPSRPPTPTRQVRRLEAVQRSGSRDDTTAIRELRHGLSQLGLADVTEQSLRSALAQTYPDGWVSIDQAELLRSVFGHLNCRNSQDNVS